MIPVAHTFRNGTIRVRLASITYRLNPGNVCAPEDPASTHVVTPLRPATASTFSPSNVIPQNPCACRSTNPGTTSFLFTSTTRPSFPTSNPAPTPAINPSRTSTSAAATDPLAGSR